MFKRIIKHFIRVVAGITLIILLVMFSPGLWNRWVRYPAFEKQVNEFQRLRKASPALTTLNTYRGLLHAHSYWSHDSEGTLATIIPAAKSAGIDFIFLTDHPHGNTDSFPRGYRGYYDGVLIEPGSEKQGFCAWPLDSAIIDWREDKDSIAREVVSNGGMLFYAHSEESHNWNNPWYQGMEVYNIHTDIKDESLRPHFFNLLINGDKYRPWAMREIFDEQKAILSRWDSLNAIRKIVGFSAVDAHENQNLRARYLEDGRVEWVGPNAKAIDTTSVTFGNRWLFEEPDEEGWIFRITMDTYATSFNYVTNYVLADTLTLASLVHHLKMGHLFFAFKSLGDAEGFIYGAQDSHDTLTAIVGDSVQVAAVKSLYATSPLPGAFRLFHNGRLIDASPEHLYAYKWRGPVQRGAYRIEVHIRLGNETVPWIYTNPIYVY